MTDKDVPLCNNLRLYAGRCVEAGGSPGNWLANAPACGKHNRSQVTPFCSKSVGRSGRRKQCLFALVRSTL